jgi:hypothetical protein
MSRGTRQPDNNGAEQLSLFDAEELATLQVTPVTLLPTNGEAPLSLEANGVRKVTSRHIRRRVANKGEATQLRLPDVR